VQHREEDSIVSLKTLKSLYAYKAWANAELFASLASLPATAAEPLKTCIRTLNHIYVVDRIFRAHLMGETRSFDGTNTPETPALSQLRAEVAANDAWYCTFVDGLPDSDLARVIHFTFTDGDLGTMTIEEILLHLVTHGAYHRGNVGQVLKSIAIAPPRDLYTRFLHLAEQGRRTPEGA